MTNHLINENELKAILNTVQNVKNGYTPDDVSLATGLPIETTKKGLLELISRYKGEILFNKISGEVTFSFIKPIVRRKEWSLSEKISKIIGLLTGIFLLVLRSSLLILLSPIFVLIFILPMIMHIISIPLHWRKIFKITKSEEFQKIKKIDIRLLLNRIIDFILAYRNRRMIKFLKNENNEYYRQYVYKEKDKSKIDIIQLDDKKEIDLKTLNIPDKVFKKRKKYNENRRVSEQKLLEITQKMKTEDNEDDFNISDKLLIDILFDYTFGLPRALYSKNDLNKRVLYLIRQSKGYLTAGLLVELEGYTINTARVILLDYVLEFEGELEISSEGILYAFFQNYSDENIELPNDAIIKYGEEIEPPYLLTGNSGNDNIRLFKLMTLPIMLSTIWIIAEIFSGNDTYPNLVIIDYLFIFFSNTESLQWFIFYYVIGITLFILIFPLIRLPFIKFANKSLEKKNIRRKLLALIFSKARNTISIDYEDLIPKPKLRQGESFLNRIIMELGGEININESGKAEIDLTLLNREMNFDAR